VLKKILDILMDVDDAGLRYLAQSLQDLRMKDVPGENVGTVVSYLNKGALLLLQNCSAVPTDTMDLLNNVMSSTDCQDFTNCMKSIYFVSKRTSTAGGYMEYLDSAESEYRTLYRKGKWTKAAINQDSGFVGDEDETDGDGYTSGGYSGRGRGRGRGGCHSRGGQYTRKRCHNCGKVGHITRSCWTPGGGSAGQGPSTPSGDDTFPGVDDEALRNPPRPGAPRERTLPNGTDVKWCGLCGKWTNHYRARHPVEGEEKVSEGDDEANVAIELADDVVEEDDPPPTGTFARLRDA